MILPVLYVTERTVLRRTIEGVELVEVAPGVDGPAHMGFRPIVRDPNPMIARLFQPKPMSMEAMVLGGDWPSASASTRSKTHLLSGPCS